MLFQAFAYFRQEKDVVIGYLLSGLLLGGEVNFNVGFLGFTPLFLDQLPLLFFDFLVNNLQPVFADEIVVRSNIPRDNRLAQSQHRLNDNLALVAAGWFHGKHNPGGIRLHHSLYRYCDANREVVKTLLLPVEDGPGSKEGCPASLNGSYHLFAPLNIEESGLLAGKGSLGQVFSRG
ncbi:hypothetical protein ES703_37600 [subsurface metagenome]